MWRESGVIRREGGRRDGEGRRERWWEGREREGREGGRKRSEKAREEEGSRKQNTKDHASSPLSPSLLYGSSAAITSATSLITLNVPTVLTVRTRWKSCKGWGPLFVRVRFARPIPAQLTVALTTPYFSLAT